MLASTALPSAEPTSPASTADELPILANPNFSGTAYLILNRRRSRLEIFRNGYAVSVAVYAPNRSTSLYYARGAAHTVSLRKGDSHSDLWIDAAAFLLLNEREVTRVREFLLGEGAAAARGASA